MTASPTIIPLSPLRKVIAARMNQANQTVPHFRLVADVELDALLALRDAAISAEPEQKVSINDYILKATACALTRHRALNVQWKDDGIYQFDQADISVVVAIDGGLLTPVVRNAETKSIREISAEIKSLVSRAKAGRLKMSEISGGTFSISNLGSYGIDQFDAIINPPQCAILAVGRAKRRVVVAYDGTMRTPMTTRVVLSLDHRAIDGATGAEFLQCLRDHIERPEWLADSSVAITS